MLHKPSRHTFIALAAFCLCIALFGSTAHGTDVEHTLIHNMKGKLTEIYKLFDEYVLHSTAEDLPERNVTLDDVSRLIAYKLDYRIDDQKNLGRVQTQDKNIFNWRRLIGLGRAIILHLLAQRSSLMKYSPARRAMKMKLIVKNVIRKEAKKIMSDAPLNDFMKTLDFFVPEPKFYETDEFWGGIGCLVFMIVMMLVMVMVLSRSRRRSSSFGMSEEIYPLVDGGKPKSMYGAYDNDSARHEAPLPFDGKDPQMIPPQKLPFTYRPSF